MASLSKSDIFNFLKKTKKIQILIRVLQLRNLFGKKNLENYTYTYTNGIETVTRVRLHGTDLVEKKKSQNENSNEPGDSSG